MQDEVAKRSGSAFHPGSHPGSRMNGQEQIKRLFLSSRLGFLYNMENHHLVCTAGKIVLREEISTRARNERSGSVASSIFLQELPR